MAAKYPEVHIAKINVGRAKFFVNKLNIQVLPAVLCFIDGVLKHRIIGFESFGNVDTFTTRQIEKKLWKLSSLIFKFYQFLKEDYLKIIFLNNMTRKLNGINIKNSTRIPSKIFVFKRSFLSYF